MTVTPTHRKLVAMSRRRLDQLLGWVHHAPGAPRQPAGTQPSWLRVLPVALLGMVFAATVIAFRMELPAQMDPIAPYEVGYHTGIHEELQERGLSIGDDLSQYGYDGQWFLGQAIDPLGRTDLATTFDNPRYRSIRVLLPAAAWLLAAGQPGAIPYTLLVMQILAVGLGCAASARIISGYGRSPWWGATFAIIPGVWLGVAYVTAEPLGVALAALGLSLVMDRRYGWAGLAFAGSALTKETYIAFAIGAALYLAVDSHLRGQRWLRPAAAMVVPVAVSIAAWWTYVERQFPPDTSPGPEWGLFERFSPPLVGWIQAIVEMVRGEFDPDFLFAGGSEAVLIASLVVLVVAVGLALRLRQTLFAYLAIGWGAFGLIIAGFMLERFTSAQRALAPAIFATVVYLFTVRVQRQRAPVEEQGVAAPRDAMRSGRPG
jgi:MFS family permease